ncbi:16S rRNA (cytidine(1402)-2'-O)-methyltransferase [Pseudogracilibacillus sp. SO30301A]|uniref:16S rRNA (cytidine(1402)-2'-O)-methyltransferase n=1 Tax=Pseudogracilibacillus sp. SO30301A TaxID=3098291 RepID=UPI00300DC9B5
MNVQVSYEEKETGTLYVVPTPIGNLEDMTFRAIKTLKEVDIIAAEDTRHTQKLLNHFEIKNRLLSYHEHSKRERFEQLIESLKQGKNVAIVSDAGMPAISDPGSELVQEVINQEMQVVVLPGANAALCALVGSGLSTDEFLFYGFLPRKKQEKEAELERLGSLKATLIFYESPYRIKDTLQAIVKLLGNRQISISREITKIYEQILRGNGKDVLRWAENNEIKGECCIVVEGNDAGEENASVWWQNLSIPDHVKHYEISDEMSHKAAMKQVAVDRGISRREVYQKIHVKK